MVFSVNELSILSPLAACIFMYLKPVTQWGEIGPTDVGRRCSSSSTCPQCVNLHYCQHVSSTRSLLHILLIGPYTSIYYTYFTMMSWLVCWSAGQGKKEVASAKKWTVAGAYSSDIRTSKLNWSLLVIMVCWFHIPPMHTLVTDSVHASFSRYYTLEFKMSEHAVTIRQLEPLLRSERQWGGTRLTVEGRVYVPHS